MTGIVTNPLIALLPRLNRGAWQEPARDRETLAAVAGAIETFVYKSECHTEDLAVGDNTIFHRLGYKPNWLVWTLPHNASVHVTADREMWTPDRIVLNAPAPVTVHFVLL